MWIEIRLSHGHFENLTYKKSSKLIQRWLDNRPFDITRYLWGVEKIDKYGEQTAEHIHYKIEIDDPDVKKNTLQKSFRDFMGSYGITLKGVKHYAIMMDIEPKDIDRWWRYAMKEKDAPIGYSEDMDEFVTEQRPQAINERELQIERNRKARDKYLDKESFKGKMYDFLYNEKNVRKQYDFCVELIKYYKDKNKVPPFSKLDDYWIDYKIITGIMTPEQYVTEKYELFATDEHDWKEFENAWDD